MSITLSVFMSVSLSMSLFAKTANFHHKIFTKILNSFLQTFLFLKETIIKNFENKNWETEDFGEKFKIWIWIFAKVFAKNIFKLKIQEFLQNFTLFSLFPKIKKAFFVLSPPLEHAIEFSALFKNLQESRIHSYKADN
jgi:hypothetical protein